MDSGCLRARGLFLLRGSLKIMEKVIRLGGQEMVFKPCMWENTRMDLQKALRKAIARGDEEKIRLIYAEIFEKYRRLVYAVCFDILGNKEDAEDVSYEAFLSLYEKLGPDFEFSSIKYYLLNTSRYLSYSKKREGEKLAPDFKDDSIGYSEDFIANLDKEESLRIMKEALSDEELVIVIEHILEERTFKEMGERRGVSENSISGKYKRALDKIKERRKRK